MLVGVFNFALRWAIIEGISFLYINNFNYYIIIFYFIFLGGSIFDYIGSKIPWKMII